jgi:putative transposase
MPDHLHFLAEGTASVSDLRQFAKSFKIKTSRQHSRDAGERLWQREFYEHILRSADSVESIAWYIWMNPVRKGFVAIAQEYPFPGSFSGMKMPTTWTAPGWCPPWKKIRCLGD